MLFFKSITIEDKEVFDGFLKPYIFLSCEYSFTTLYIWRNYCDIQYSIYNGTLIIKKKDFNGKYYFMQPIGYRKEQLKNIVDELKVYKEKNNMDFLFKDIEPPFLNELEETYINKIDFLADRDNFDYIYEAEKLMKLSGKKYHGKKNHYNSFIKTYDYEVKDILEVNVKQDIVKLAKFWYDQNDNGTSALKYELEGIVDLLENMNKLEVNAMAVYVDGKIEGFTIGQKMNDEFAIIHIEKCNAEIRGIYAFINKTFVENYFSDVNYINREQDLGIEGLRKAKTSYYPLKLQEKYVVNI